jgi:hypothetical protein
MAKVLRFWTIQGSDGKTYIVEEVEVPGPISRPLSGVARALSTGQVEYVLADGTDLFDDTPGMWETPWGAMLKKPIDL